MTGRVASQPVVPTLGVRPSLAFVTWGLWLSVVLSCLAVAGVTFLRFLASGSEPLVVGPLAVNPDLSGELVRLFGSDGPIRVGQAFIHVSGFVVYVATGLFIVARRPSSWLPLLASAMLVLVGTSLFAPLGTLQGSALDSVPAVLGTLSPDAIGSFWVSLSGLALVAFFLCFPDRAWVPSWGRWGLALLAALGVVSIAVPDPAALPWRGTLGVVLGVAVPSALIAAQAYRWWLDRGDEGRRARPVVLSFGFVIGVFFMIWVVRPELTADAYGLVLATPRLAAVYDVNLLALLTLAVFAFPLSIWVGIARYRLFDIELIVNRALVYGSVTVLVGAGVLAVVVLFAAVLGVPGSEAPGRGAAAGAVAGALAVTVHRPLRRRVQRAVDRRFFHEKYAIDSAIEVFAVAASQVVDLNDLVTGVRTVVEDGFAPDGIDVWLADRFHSSLQPEQAVYLQQRAEAVVITDDERDPLDLLFGDGWRAAVPFVAQHRLVAVAVLGERSGGPYSGLDLELLDGLARRLAPSFHLAELVQRQEQDALERERVAGEMEAARRIQVELLPSDVPHIDGWSVEALYRPARQVGGDFYDFISLRNGCIAIVVGDVTGKGIPAAMVMTTCRAMLRSATHEDGDEPGRVLSQVNEQLRSNIPAGMFVTCLYAVLDTATGTLVFANAGHDLPYLKRGQSASAVRASGMPLGLMPDMVYAQTEISLDRGDTLLFSTDGLVEIHGPEGDMLGFPRFADMVAAAGDEQDLIPDLLAAQRSFTGPDWEQEDDITLLVVHRH